MLIFPNSRITGRGRNPRPLFLPFMPFRSADFLDRVADMAAVHPIEINKRILTAVVIDPLAAMLPEHDIILGGTVTAVGVGRLAAVPGIEGDILAALPDDVAVLAVCTDPDTVDPGLLGQGDDLVHLFFIVDDRKETAVIMRGLLGFKPAHIRLDHLIGVRCVRIGQCQLGLGLLRLLFGLLLGFQFRLLRLLLRLLLKLLLGHDGRDIHLGGCLRINGGHHDGHVLHGGVILSG